MQDEDREDACEGRHIVEETDTHKELTEGTVGEEWRGAKDLKARSCQKSEDKQSADDN